MNAYNTNVILKNNMLVINKGNKKNYYIKFFKVLQLDGKKRDRTKYKCLCTYFETHIKEQLITFTYLNYLLRNK